MEKLRPNKVELDVRPHLRKKLEPFQLIMETVKKLKKDDVFVLHATFKPTPLLGLMRTKGFVNKTEKRADDHWVVTFVSRKNKHLLETFSIGDRDGNGSPDTDDPASPDTASALAKTGDGDESGKPKTIELDNRGLEPPQPMVRTLSALERCRPGDEVIIHNDRVPVFLIEELNNLGYPHSVEEQPDGSAKVKIRKT